MLLMRRARAGTNLAACLADARRVLVRAPAIQLLLICFVPAFAVAEVKVVVDGNVGARATPQFKFEHIPSPARNDAGAGAKLALVVGDSDGSSSPLSVLTDGNLPSSEDQPSANFFFAAGADGGRILVDLGQVMDVGAVNTYSWHPSTRGPQVYNLYASDGNDPMFTPKPGEDTHPVSCGWRLIAKVDTRPEQGEGGGQYGVNITDTSGTLGKFRYLLFDSVPTEVNDLFGNTFFSEVDVVTK
jgi:hypothetical protein